jgi:hypothetical protein
MHRRKILFEREKSMLPAMQIFVEAKRNVERISVAHQAAIDSFVSSHNELSKLRADLRKYEKETYNELVLRKAQGQITEAEKPAYKAARDMWKGLRQKELDYHSTTYLPRRRHMSEVYGEYSYWLAMYNNGTAGGERQKREFMMRCPADECRGFLSTAYKCGTCEKHTCSECLEVLGLPDETIMLEAMKDAHTCKSDNVESAKLIKKETRPCPKCGARIFKIEGCDQMFCTVEGCHTAFSWNSGHVVTGRIHNPHYYEWLRRNGGEAPREAGDIPCGGVPAAGIFMRLVLRNTQLTNEEKNRLLEIHRNTLDFEARLIAFPARPDALMNKEINVAYLMNKMTEDEWKRKLELTEAAFNRKKEIGQLLQTFVTATADILQGIVGQMEDPTRSPAEIATYIRAVATPNLESLRDYTNESYVTMSKARHMAAPQVGARWNWLGVRALYKPEGQEGPPPLDMGNV